MRREAHLVENEWVRIAVFDPDAGTLQVYRQGRFEPYVPETSELPVAPTSLDWYRGQRDHLGFASVVAGRQPNLLPHGEVA